MKITQISRRWTGEEKCDKIYLISGYLISLLGTALLIFGSIKGWWIL